MKKLLRFLFIVTIFAFTASLYLSAQCKGFAKKICKTELSEGYIHDGNYHAAILTEGEEAELYKTFYSGQDYRIAICGSNALPDVEFQIIDSYKNILYDNRQHNLTRIWDFRLESSQQLKIAVKVPVGKGESEYPASGCVAIMFGFREK
jgi:hypothetical protein